MSTKIYSVKKLQIASKKHDVTGIRIFDNREKFIPNVGLIEVHNAENKETIWVNTNASSVRNAYTENYKTNETYCKNSFSKCAAGLVNIITNESYVYKLFTYFKNKA